MPDTPEAGAFVPLATLNPGTNQDEGSLDDGTWSTRSSSLELSIDGDSQLSATRKLTRLNGVALVISLQIGSGIFTAPSHVSQYVTSPGWGVLIWIFGGLLVWTGAASFIELGLRIPHNGGIQEYLCHAYGNVMGFLFTWTWVAIAKPATNAIIASIFADYLTRPFVAGPVAPTIVLKVVGLLCIAAVTFINGIGATAGAKVANMFLVIKLLALSSIVVIGGLFLLSGKGEGVPQSDSGWFGSTDLQPPDAWSWLGNFGTALFGALFCYGGWETVGFVMGNMRNPEGDLPIVIHGSMTTVILGFALMNVALYICLPLDVMRSSSTVAVEFARRTLGGWGGFLYSIAVSISAMGALNANTFATAILAVTASKRGYLPSILANSHCSGPKHEDEYFDGFLPGFLSGPMKWFAERTRRLRWERSVPILALAMNALMASFYLLIGTFNGLVTFIGLAEYAFFFASVVGLLIIRRREGSSPATVSYQTSTANPVIFAVVSGLLVVRVLISQPGQGLGIFLVGSVGLAIFYLRSRQGKVKNIAHN